MGNLFVATSQALSNAAHNATNNQQQSYVTMQAATTQGVSTLYALDTGSAGIATDKVLGLVAGREASSASVAPWRPNSRRVRDMG